MAKFLKRFRIIFAAIVFVIITCGFLNISGGNSVSQLFLKTQFVPAMVSVFTGSAVAAILLLVLTLLFGRVYCSFLCPLGIFQDIISYISNFFKKRKNGGRMPKQSYRKPHTILRYSILALIIVCLVLGLTYPLDLLDPYSNYGKIAGHLFYSAEMLVNNILSKLLPDTFYYQQYSRITVAAFAYTTIFFLIVTVLSAIRGRLYCNSICPVGTLLGVIGGASLFKPVIQKDKCVKCNLCANSCKSNCINLETKEIDATRCVACYNCLASCKRGGVKLVPTWFKKQNPQDSEYRSIENKERRNALIALGGVAAALATRKLALQGKRIVPIGNNEEENTPILPPGARNLEAFTYACTTCHACIAACPNQIIKPAALEYGIEGIMLPTLKFDKKYCSYECNACSTTCPHGALAHISLEEKQKTQIAIASYDPSSCVVIMDGIKCGACAKVCPTGAIQMKENPAVPGQFLPDINKEKCIGCGACKYTCPAMPKAITIEGKTVQTMCS